MLMLTQPNRHSLFSCLHDASTTAKATPKNLDLRRCTPCKVNLSRLRVKLPNTIKWDISIKPRLYKHAAILEVFVHYISCITRQSATCSNRLQLTLPTVNQLRSGARDAQLARLFHLLLEDDGIALLPHLRHERLTRYHDPGKSYFDVLEHAIAA